MPSVDIPVATPRLQAITWTSDTLHVSMKEHHVVARVERGRLSSFTGGQIFHSEPGSVHVKQPGDIYRELDRDGPGRYTIIAFPDDEIEQLRATDRVVTVPHMDPRDTRALPFHRLVDGVIERRDRLTLEVSLAEAVSSLAELTHGRSLHTRPVRRAMEYLREHLVGTVSLDALAAYCERDKFYLCRAFRAQVGMPPHAYLVHLRVLEAKKLLRAGERPSFVATAVGFYDQAQLTRHFRRITETTPAVFARAHLGKSIGQRSPASSENRPQETGHRQRAMKVMKVAASRR